jgi:hypothetical protein
MTEHQRKLMFFGQSVLNLIDPTEMQYEWDDILDRVGDNAIDLGLAEWVKQEDGSHEFKLTEPNK